MVAPISSGNPVYTHTTHEQKVNNNGAQAHSNEQANNTNQTDSVEISDRARELAILRKSFEANPTWEMVSKEEEAKGGWYSMHDDGVVRWTSAKDVYLEKGLDGLVAEDKSGKTEVIAEALKFLVPEKKAISDEINRIGKNAGLSQSDINKLKIEVDSKGKIVVGGIKDEKKLKAMQSALNKEDGFASRIKNYQTSEMILRRETSSKRGEAATADNFVYNKRDPNAPQLNFGYEAVERACQGLDSADELTGFDNPLDYALAEFFMDDTPSADFSYGAKGVANPVGALDRWKSDLTNGMRAKLQHLNQINDAQNDPDAMLSLDNVSFKITEGGGIEIEGRFAKSDAAHNEAKAIIEAMILEAMGESSEDGRESLFETAMSSMVMAHNDAFGDSGAKMAVIEFNSTGVNAYVDSPGKKESIKDEMTNQVSGFVNSSLNGVASTSADDFAIDDKGKIIYQGSAEGQAKEAINAVLSSLTESMNSLQKDAEATEPNQTARNLVDLVAELRSYGPDADKGYLQYKSVAEEAFIAEDTRMDFLSRFDYKHSFPNGSYKGGERFSFGNYVYQQYATNADKAKYITSMS